MLTNSQWLHNYFAMPEEQKGSILAKINKFKTKPLISLITPVYNTKKEWLDKYIESVLGQLYPNWELCLCDNGSEPPTSVLLHVYAKRDSRIKVTKVEINEGGYKGMNAALDISTGSYIGMSDSDDELTADALYLIAYTLNVFPKTKIMYSDEILMSENNTALPYFKTKFNADLLCFQHCFSHLAIYESTLMKKLRFRHCGGSYDYDLSLRATEIVPPEEIYHLPAIIYKYRTYPTSTSAATQETCLEGGLGALQEHLQRLGVPATASRNGYLYQVQFDSGEFLQLPKIDYDEMLAPYSDYPEPDRHLLKIILGD